MRNILGSFFAWFFVSIAHFWEGFDIWGRRIATVLAIIVSILTLIKMIHNYFQHKIKND